MFCTKCGANIADGSTFCTSCGQPQNSAAQAQPQAQPQQYQAQPQQFQAQPQFQGQAPVGGTTGRPLFGLSFLENEKANPQDALMQKICKIALPVAGLLSFIFSFIPFYKVSFWGISESVNLFGMEGFYAFTAVLFILCGLGTIALSGLMKGALQKFTIATGGVIFLFDIIAGIKAKSDAAGIGSLSGCFILELLLSIVIIACGVLTLVKKLDQ